MLAVIVLLTACQRSEETALRETYPTWTAPPRTAPAPSLASTESVSTPTPKASPHNRNQLPFLKPYRLLTSEFTNEDFQDLIIFTSTMYVGGVFANFPLDIWWAEAGEEHLYAFSPDGQRAGTLLPEEFASTSYLSPNPSDKPILVEYGVAFDHPAVQGIELPSECYQPGPGEDRLIACGNFQFSPDGQYLGFFYGDPECWRGIIIQNTQTGEQVYHSTYPNGHSFLLLDNGKALIATGHCEGGGLTFHNLTTGEEKPLAGEGQQTWNLDNSAFAVVVGSYAGLDTNIWGFNL
jgi:hypothetical protein